MGPTSQPTALGRRVARAHGMRARLVWEWLRGVLELGGLPESWTVGARKLGERRVGRGERGGPAGRGREGWTLFPFILFFFTLSISFQTHA